MNKSDLKTGMYLQVKTGSEMRFVEGHFVTEGLEIIKYGAYKEDLTDVDGNTGFDIIKVFDKNKKLLWRRQATNINFSRIIKFRAWDKEIGKMYYNAQDTYDYGIFVGNEECPEESFKNVIQNDNYVLMQYTNIKDYEGKEIFEGDIVKKEFMEQWLEDTKFIGIVKMIEGCWCVVNDKKKVAKNLWSETDANHVIGNIYEDQELLEVK